MHVCCNDPSWAVSLFLSFSVVCRSSATDIGQHLEEGQMQDIPVKIQSLFCLSLWFQMHIILLNTPVVSVTWTQQKNKKKTLTVVWPQQKAGLFKWLINTAYNHLWSCLHHLSRVDLGAVSVKIYWTKTRWLISYQRLRLVSIEGISGVVKFQSLYLNFNTWILNL